MPTTTVLHVTPEGEAWAVKLDGSSTPSSVHPTRVLAVASAFEMLQGRDGVEVLVHGEDGRVRSSLTIRQIEDDIDEAEDAALRAEAFRRTPSYARLKAGIGKYPPPQGDFDNEEMPY
jgi:Uncharacterized protein conserved in bacteria (DUF2188)